MCGRFNLRLSPVELQEFFDLFRVPQFGTGFNIAPTQNVVAIRADGTGRRNADLLRWGLIPSWAKDLAIGSSLINARAETIIEKPAFRAAVKRRRCLIPISGFYEWQKIDAKTKQPWHIESARGEPLALAGLWETWQPTGSDAIESCSIVTTEANDFMSPIHNRMPVILPEAAWDEWLDPKRIDPTTVTHWLQPCPDEWLKKTPVTTFVNNVRNQGTECITPA